MPKEAEKNGIDALCADAQIKPVVNPVLCFKKDQAMWTGYTEGSSCIECKGYDTICQGYEPLRKSK